MFVPFFVCDLFYAYNGDASCVHTQPLPGSSIDMSLNQWLQVDGYITLSFLIIFFLIGLIACISYQVSCVYVLWEALHVFFIIWRMVWLIVGSIVFWKGLNEHGLCGGAVGKFMWANLIIGFVWLFVELVLAFAYPRVARYPMSTIPTVAYSASTVKPVMFQTPTITTNYITGGRPF
jgi:hypothetical protein